MEDIHKNLLCDCVLTNEARKVHGHEITLTLVPRNVMIF
jgi:hypothetical protein